MPIVVTTISSVAVRASTRNPKSTVKLPAGIQVHSLTVSPSSPNGSRCWSAGITITIAMTQVATITPSGTSSAAVRPKRSWSRRPNSAVNAKPEMGSRTRSGISVSYIGAYCRIASYSSTSGVRRLR